MKKYAVLGLCRERRNRMTENRTWVLLAYLSGRSLGKNIIMPMMGYLILPRWEGSDIGLTAYPVNGVLQLLEIHSSKTAPITASRDIGFCRSAVIGLSSISASAVNGMSFEGADVFLYLQQDGWLNEIRAANE